MDGIVICLGISRNRRFRKEARQAKDAKLATRYRIILNLDQGRSVADTARAVGAAETTVRRVRLRFLEQGEAGLVDRREDNGATKVTDDFLGELYEVVEGSPTEYGYPRPTWTRELLVMVMKKRTGIKIHVSTMSHALARIGARRGRPKPIVNSTWSKSRKNQRLSELRQLRDNLPFDEVLVYQDEVDIHLNPKIGDDWMVPGQQKEVLTPGQNQKRYLAGAQDAVTGELVWVEGESKNSLLFIQLLWQLTLHYPKAKKIHVILDNYSIHSTEQVRLSLATAAGRRIQLHFLPPYCPDDNKIERTWQDLHANVTRNHKNPDMPSLMKRVRQYLRRRNRKLENSQATAA